VECFYLFVHEAEEKTRYLSFPSAYTNLSYLEQAHIHSGNGFIIILGDSLKPPAAVIRIHLLKPCIVEYSGPVRELTIFFRPAGIHFFPSLAVDGIPPDEFHLYTPDQGFIGEMNEMLVQAARGELMTGMETFLFRHYRSFEHPFIFRALEMFDRDPDSTAEEVADRLGISRKTLHVHFEKFVRISPALYRRIIRFRRSVSRHKELAATPGKLTSLAHIVSYFDQSHMIRDFRALTGFTPRTFFRQMQAYEEVDIYRMFI
jgi:AraC-like DNA-binding protein